MRGFWYRSTFARERAVIIPISRTTLRRLRDVEVFVALTELESGGVDYPSLKYGTCSAGLARTREMRNLVDGKIARYNGRPEMIQLVIRFEDHGGEKCPRGLPSASTRRDPVSQDS